MLKDNPLKGDILIAEPSIISDSSFNRSMVLLVEHSNDGTVGFILNKETGLIANDIIENLDVPIPLYYGGPVESDCLFYIHNRPDLIEGGIKISSDLYWGGNFKNVCANINMGILDQTNIRLFMGYSGWQPEQLFDEITSKSWLIMKMANDLEVFKLTNSTFWKSEMIKMGGDYLIWANSPENPTLN